MTNDFSACRTGDCRRLIRRVVIDHDDVIEVLEYATHDGPDKACLTEGRNNRANILPGRLNHLLTSWLSQSKPGYETCRGSGADADVGLAEKSGSVERWADRLCSLRNRRPWCELPTRFAPLRLSYRSRPNPGERLSVCRPRNRRRRVAAPDRRPWHRPIFRSEGLPRSPLRGCR